MDDALGGPGSEALLALPSVPFKRQEDRVPAELLIEWDEPEGGDLERDDDAFAFEDDLDVTYRPVRDPRTRRNARSVTGALNSVRDGHAHVFESLGEMRHAAILDVHPEVVRFATQPERIVLSDGRTYTPDAKVWFADGIRAYREVKPRARLQRDPSLAGKVSLIAAACAVKSAIFQIVTDDWYNACPRLPNAHWLRRAVKRSTTEHVKAVAELLEKTRGLPLSEIGPESGLGNAGRLAACALAGLRRCVIDLQQPIGDDTFFRLGSRR